jgi:hypothetical protein
LITIEGVVLTETTAKKIFGTTDVIGKTIRLNHREDMLVTGVVKDLPDNLSFNAQIFVSSENSTKKRLIYSQGNYSHDGEEILEYPFHVFIKLDKQAVIREIEKQISDFHNLNNYIFPEKVKLAPFSSNYFNTEISEGD